MKFQKRLRLRLEFARSGWQSSSRAPSVQQRPGSPRTSGASSHRALADRNERLQNLELAYPEKSPGERKAIAAAMWENLGRTFAESLHIQALTKGDRIVFEPPEGFDEAASGAKPFIVCGLHLGNWEILAHGGQRLGVSLIGVYQRLSNPHVETLMRRLREPLYKAGLTPKTPMAAHRILRAIKDGASPCFLADLRDDNGPHVPFFGQPARSTVFPALLARTTGIPLYAGAAFRRPGARFSIRIAPIPMPQTNNSAADALVATQALQRQYEAFIREAPEQWMWAHRKSGLIATDITRCGR